MRALNLALEKISYESIRFSSISTAELPCKTLLSARIDLGVGEDCYFGVLSSARKIDISYMCERII